MHVKNNLKYLLNRYHWVKAREGLMRPLLRFLCDFSLPKLFAITIMKLNTEGSSKADMVAAKQNFTKNHQRVFKTLNIESINIFFTISNHYFYLTLFRTILPKPSISSFTVYMYFLSVPHKWKLAIHIKIITFPFSNLRLEFSECQSK